MAEEKKSFKMGEDSRTGEFVSYEVAKLNLDRYRIIHVPRPGTDKRFDKLRDLIYEPEHEKAPCWCNPSFIKKKGKMHIIHNEQREIIVAFVKKHFKCHHPH